MLVVFEGVDACGKDTIAEKVAKEFDAKLFRFPNDDLETGQMIRHYLARDWQACDRAREPLIKREQGLVFQALQVMNRMEIMHELADRDVSDTLAGVLVRYWHSGWVYGQMDGLDGDWLLTVHQMMVQPSIHILLDVSAETSLERLAERGDVPEIYEGKLEFTKQVVERYRNLWDLGASGVDPRLTGEWARVNAENPISDVMGDVMDALGSF